MNTSITCIHHNMYMCISYMYVYIYIYSYIQHCIHKIYPVLAFSLAMTDAMQRDWVPFQESSLKYAITIDIITYICTCNIQ